MMSLPTTRRCFSPSICSSAFAFGSTARRRRPTSHRSFLDSSRCIRRCLSTEAARIVSSLPISFLRQSDPALYDPTTFQRNNVVFDETNGKPISSYHHDDDNIKILHCQFQDPSEQEHNEPPCYKISWSDGRESVYTETWMNQALQKWESVSTGTTTQEYSSSDDDRIFWRGLTEQDLRGSSSSHELSLSFPHLLTNEGMDLALRALYRYGILLVTETPIHDTGAGVAALGAALGGGHVKNQTSLCTTYQEGNEFLQLDHGTDGPLRTLYGTVWSTTSSGQAEGASVADSAYGQDALPLHTDMTYLRDPPGLQIFTMMQTAVRGGESVFGDGFAVAAELRRHHPDAFETLCQIPRRYQCRDVETGWHLQAQGPVIVTSGNRLVGIRHNDLDRLPDLPSNNNNSHDDEEAYFSFYQCLHEAHQAWDDILAQDESRLVVSLQPGETVVVANQRCFHGRYRFETTPEQPRAVRGCYVAQDELNSRFRMAGYRVD